MKLNKAPKFAPFTALIPRDAFSTRPLARRYMYLVLAFISTLFSYGHVQANELQHCSPHDPVGLRVLNHVEPVYPSPPNRPKEYSGWVDVKLIVEVNGLVAEAIVEDSSDQAFEKVTLEAVNTWVFIEPKNKCLQSYRLKFGDY